MLRETASASNSAEACKYNVESRHNSNVNQNPHHEFSEKNLIFDFFGLKNNKFQTVIVNKKIKLLNGVEFQINNCKRASFKDVE